MKQYVFRNLCENFIQIGQKNEKFIAYTICVPPAVIFERAATHSREDKGWGNGVMYCFFLLC